jgi:hypothetical protein
MIAWLYITMSPSIWHDPRYSAHISSRIPETTNQNLGPHKCLRNPPHRTRFSITTHAQLASCLVVHPHPLTSHNGDPPSNIQTRCRFADYDHQNSIPNYPGTSPHPSTHYPLPMHLSFSITNPHTPPNPSQLHHKGLLHRLIPHQTRIRNRDRYSASDSDA